MSLYLSITVFLFGLVFGSFFNVVGLRLPIGEPFANERSKCPACHKQLSWFELIPLISYAALRGKCRHCSIAISWKYPVMEAITGLLFLFSFLVAKDVLHFILSVLLVSLLTIVLVSDLAYMIIPDQVLLVFSILFLCVHVIQSGEIPVDALFGGAAGIMIIAFIIFISKGGIGAGDMKLFGAVGIVLGAKKVILAFMLSCMIGGIIGSVLLLLKVVKPATPIPFVPFIIVGVLITYFFGDASITWYNKWFS
ncbi:prepilin peptidase [Virgibacillus sp. 179-BFC.A HS]|uniref:Prepilin peptidase n=1 Tax=Tigheibacillus jepli TaxID=3035914 RepID=A0ABU5CG97_9BACI|nr:A24 family peptidase [Virgibacillus sp. 179-BFC.A HS]MDY0405339.1 prepilin peptidase [Virgibacillus sp. 179-BFC.A HS]